MTRRLYICDTAADVATTAAGLIADIAPGIVALSGGNTPRSTYELLAKNKTLSHADVWLADERCVPPESPDSNYRLIKETFGESIGAIHRVRGEDPPPEAARIYDDEIRAAMGDEPVFDLVVLGMGADGHTASLFPGSPELDERERRAVDTAQPHAGFFRVTLTLPVLNRARHALFLVTGIDKAQVFARIQDGELLPAGRVLGATWVLDKAAATAPVPVPRKRKAWEPIEGQESLFDL